MKAPPTLTVSPDTMRRFIAQRQGLVQDGDVDAFSDVDRAIRAFGSLQMDPLTIVARSHDLVLHARVAGYQPSMLAEAAYERHLLFEYGGVLAVHPQEHLPFWRRHMQTRREDQRYLDAMAALGDNGRSLIRTIAEHGPQTAREIASRRGDSSTSRTATSGSYRSQRVTDKGLYQLWLGGKLVTHGRTDSFERVYDVPGPVVPMASPQATIDFFLQHTLHKQTVSNASDLRSALAGGLHQRVGPDVLKAALARLEESGAVCRVAMDGQRQPMFMLSTLIPRLQDIAETPSRPASRQVKIAFLSPLDPMVASARRLFAYDYIWEIYKPASRRQYGPFTMPILYGHELVGRADLRTDRAASLLVVNGIWLEDTSLVGDEHFTHELRDALRRLAEFTGVTSVEIVRGEPCSWTEALRAELRS